MGEIAVERSVECKASARALWPLITDTERVNRVIGLGRIELSPNDDDSAARYLVKTVSGGFPLEYEERPYEWVEPERFSVKRIVRRGLLRTMDNRFILEPSGDGTRVTVRVAVVPKFGVIAPIVRLQVARFVGRLANFVERMDEEASGGGVLTSDDSRIDAEGLDRLAKGLFDSTSGDELVAAQKLVELIRTGADQRVDRIRPYELARSWGLPDRAVLEACLQGVSAGVLELMWDLVCPSCRTASERMRALSALGAHAHCQLCDISYDLDLDRAVEATFRPPDSLRTVDEGPYCIGGPARTPHVLVQAILPPEQTVELAAPLSAGRYRLFVRGGPAAILRVHDDGAEGLDSVASEAGLEPAQADVRPGALLRVRSSHARERHVKLERVDFAGDAATAHDISMLPAFRSQFAREVLRPGLTLRIARVALLFTDLTGSTALYTAIGDAKAFGVVQDHFELLRAVIAEFSGTIVKTIGDAVMAAFASEADAVRAAAAMHARFPEFRRGSEDATGVTLKIGLHAGACYVVTANGVLDYFGQTVNIAARLQGAAGAGELVLTEELTETALREGWLAPDAPREAFEAQLKGLARSLAAVRMRLDAGG